MATRRGPVEGTCGRIRAGSLERGELATRASQEPVEHGVGALVGSRDNSPNVDAAWVGSVVIPWRRVRARSVKGNDAGLLSARSRAQPQHA